jgi:prophage antirepressor-like protein
MTGEMQLFTQRIGDHNVAVNALQVRGDPWFRANDVCMALGYRNLQQAVRLHVHEEDRQSLDNLRVLETDRCPLENSSPLEHNEAAQVFINESGVYSLIMRSKKPEARLFQRWVTNEVLPSIRRTGEYSAPDPSQQQDIVDSADLAASRPSPYELEMVRSARMQALTAAYTAAQAIGSSSQPRLQTEVQKAIDDLLLPQGCTADQYVDADAILRERGHGAHQTSRLAGELGKDLKLIARSEERQEVSCEGQFGADRRQLGLYHRVKDAPLIEAALSSFKQRDLYRRVVAGQPDPDRARREELLDQQGRGRSRSQREATTRRRMSLTTSIL